MTILFYPDQNKAVTEDEFMALLYFGWFGSSSSITFAMDPGKHS